MDVKSVVEILMPLLKKLRERKIYTNMFVKNGQEILNKEHDLDSEIFSQLEVLFSEENLKKLSKTTRKTSGYDIVDLIRTELEKVFIGYNFEESSRNKYIEDFLLALKDDIKLNSSGIYAQIYLKEFRDENKESHDEILEKQKELKEGQNDVSNKIDKLTNIKNLYMTIEQVDAWLKAHTNPSIGLNFFDYEERQFVDDLKRGLLKNEIYIQGKTREEVVYYILFILKNINDENLLKNTYVVNSLDNWDKLKNTLKDSILIPNFNASEVEIIPENKNIIIFGKEDFVGKKEPIILKNRIRNNMYQKLTGEDVEFELANNITNETNGLFSVFKRMVFKGKVSKPKWEEKCGPLLIPALLLGKWTESDGDKDTLSELSGKVYNEYLQSINDVVGGEDPFVLKTNNFSKIVYKIANVEEAWEILFNKISEKDIICFKSIAEKIILSIDPIFELDPSKHFLASLTADKPKYSLELKSGIIRSLIMLANSESKSNNCNIGSMQHFVDIIIEEILTKVTSAKDWFGISQIIDDMVEASPEIVLSRIETEIETDSSPLWDLFVKQDGGFGSRNYYTYVLWALEKLLCMKDYVPRAVFVLAKLSERDIKYSLSNKPIATLEQVFCAWIHEINLTIEEKIQLAETIVKDYKIGWELLEMILPTRVQGKAFSSMSKPKYRSYNFAEELKFEDQMWETYKEYIKIAIKYAKYDLSKWSVVFRECFFFELGLENEVFSKVNVVISNCQCDEEKFKFKEQIRSTLYQHRFYNDANWTLKKEYTDKLETEVFNKIEFSNPIYDYLYLFNSYQPKVINPEPYSDNYDFDKEENNIKEIQLSAIGVLAKDNNFNFIELVSKIEDTGYGYIGAIIAEKLHNNEFHLDFLIEIAKLNKISILKSYIYSIYNNKGNTAIKEILLDERIRLISSDIKSEILSVATIDQEFLSFIDSLDGELKKTFWKYFWHLGKSNDSSVLDQIINRLIEYNNYGHVLKIINREGIFGIERHLDILEKILRNQENYSLQNSDSYYIKKSFDVIYQECYPEKKEKERITSLEIEYIKVLSREMKLKYINYTLRTEPEFLAELIRMSYKSSEDEEKVFSDEERQNANVAFEILFHVKFCPCVTDDGILEFETLNKWVEDFFSLIDKNNHSIIGMQTLGNCLAHSPLGFDNIFPHEAVRKIIEKYYSKDLETGFHIEINNQRGVHTATSGVNEKEISNKYLKYANAIKISSPKTAKILLAISKGYQRESELERERAENGL